MKTHLRFLKKAAFAALLPAFALALRANTTNIVPVATASLANPSVADIVWSAVDSNNQSTLTNDLYEVVNNGTAVSIDTGSDSLVYAPTTIDSTVSAELSLNFSAATTAPTGPGGAQTAITAYIENGTAYYFVYSKGVYGATGAPTTDPSWVKIDDPNLVPATTGTEVPVSFVIDYQKKVVSYTIDGTNAGQFYLADMTATAMNSLNFQGTGTLDGTIATKAAGPYELLDNGSSTYYASESDAKAAVASSTATLKTWSYDSTNGVWDDSIESTISFRQVALSWPDNLTSVSYKIGSAGSPTALTPGDAQATIYVEDGATVYLTGTHYATAEVNKTFSADGSLALDECIELYFPLTQTGGQDGSAQNPYEIADANGLNALKDAVANLPAARSLCYKQTADIDMTSAGAFAGIGAVGAENETTLTMTAFEGVYDGNNKTISNITFTNRKGSGIFNLVRGATIKDLTVDTVSYEAPFAASKLGGAMIVGNGVDCTLQHLVTLGSNGENNPSTYNAAGIANRLEGRGGPVLVIGCTNNAAIYSVYTKVAGICSIVQGDTELVTFVDCANTGSIVANGTAAQIANNGGKTPGADGASGILAYSQAGNGTISMTNCVNTGSITGVDGTTKGTIIGKTSTTGIMVSGGSAQADMLSVGSGAGNVSGIKFATVSNGVATFVADDALALNGEYKVMAGSATATYNFTNLGSISFDEALATPTYNITSSGVAGIPVASTSGTVTTYTTGYFPRTATAGQDGTTGHPYEIADVDDLEALAAYTAGHGLCYVQTADIDMSSAGTFPGIGGDFTGTYDGGNKTISNIKFSASNYRGLFNKVTGATIKNLTIDTVTFDQDATKEVAGAAFVGKSYGNSTYSNLVARGSIGTAANPCNHNTAGIIARIYDGSPTIVDCANEADIYCGFSKVGGICAIIQGATKATFIRCSNSGSLNVPATYVNLDNNSTVNCGKDGVAGIIAYANTACDFEDCSNTGSLNCLNTTDASVGQIIGKCGNVTNTDLGGNSASDSKPMIGVRAGTINGFQYATVAGGVATTIDPPYTLADNTTYLLEGNVASGTVHTLDNVGEYIAFDTALGYTFAGTVDNSGTAGIPVASTVGTVTTYTAGYFPRTATAGQDGTAAHPYEIADVDDLEALAAYTAGHGLCYVQTADIDMSSAGTFPGIGGDFTGTYDGGNKTISNIKFSASNYRGLFNKVTGATIKNLTIDTVTFDQDATKEVAGAAFVGKSYGNSTYSNLVARGSIGTAANPCNHNTAGIIARIYDGSPTIVDCANEADIYCGFSKVGGICAIIQGATKATFIRCSNSGSLNVPATYVNLDNNSTVNCGKDGVAGIIAYANTACDFEDCSNTGSLNCLNTTDASVGQIIGKCGNVTNTDLGGNSASDSKPMIGVRAGTINGFQYATVAGGVATTIDPPYTLADNTTYLLEGNVASGTVHTLDNVGEYIAFDTALGYSFGGDVAGANGLVVTDDGGTPVVTYTALGTPTVSVALTGWTYGDAANSPVVTYNGTTPYTGSYTVSYSDDGQTFDSNPRTAAGNYTVKVTVDAAGNYAAADATTTFAIAQRALGIVADGATKVYDSTALTKNTYQIASGSLAAGDSIDSVTITGSQTTVGSSDNVASAATIKDGNGGDVTANYAITFPTPYNTLTVTAKQVAVPASLGTLIYSASAQTPTVPTTAEYSIASVTAQTDAGNYSAVIALNDTANTEWDLSTPTTANQTVAWKIDPALLQVNVNDFDIDHGTANNAVTYSLNYGLPQGSDTIANIVATAPTATSQYDVATASVGDQFIITVSGGSIVQNSNGLYNYTFEFPNVNKATVVSKKYTVTWQDYTGADVATAQVEWGDMPTAPATAGYIPASDAVYTYTFDDWTPSTNAPVTAATSYRATYTGAPTLYTIRFLDYNNNPIETRNLGLGTNVTAYAGSASAIPTSDAQWTYTQTGWNPAVPFTVTGDQDVTPAYTTTRNTYTVTWLNYNDALLETDPSVPYGDAPSYDGSTPIRPATTAFIYTFSGWSPSTNTTVTGNQTYTAQFSAQPRNPPPLVTLATNETLYSVSAQGASVVVSSVVAHVEGEVDLDGGEDATFSDIDGSGRFTGTFTSPGWNQPRDWSITAVQGNSETAELAGRAYVKGETEWFTKAADALDEVDDFGDDIERGVDMTGEGQASPANQMVRINTRLEIAEGGMDAAPGVGTARGGFAVLKLTGDDAPAYYAFTGNPELGTDGWVKLFGADPVAGEHDVLIAVDTAANVAYYYIDGASLFATSITRASTYAIPVGEGTTVSAIGFANPEGVKSAVVAEYDVPFVAAIGDVAYTNAAAAISAVAKDGTETLELLANVDPATTINLASGESIKIKAGSYTGLTVDTEVAGKTVVESAPVDGVVTYRLDDASGTAIWIGGISGDWENVDNWDIDYIPTKATVVTFTNNAEVAIDHSDVCKELVLDNANVTLVRASGVEQPILHIYGNEGRAVSVSSGATGSLGVSGISLFTESMESNDLTISCDLEIMGDISLRGISHGSQVSASFAITGKTTISGNAKAKTIDWGTTKFQGGIEVAKGVTAKITTQPNGYASIMTGVTLVANDGEGAPTAIWLMKTANNSGGVSLSGASVAVDANHADDYYVKTSTGSEDGVDCDVYEAILKHTILWTDHSGTVKTEKLVYGATPSAPDADPVQYVENGVIYNGTWPTPVAVEGDTTYAATYTAAGSAIATVITIAENEGSVTTNTVGTYASLKAAVEAAPAGSTVVLLADDDVSFAGVTVTDRIPSNGSIVIDKDLTIDGDGHTVTGVSNAEILNATGAATPGYDMAADLVNGSNLLGFFVKSGDVTFKNLTLTEFGDTAYVNKFGYTPIQTASAYADDLVLENVDIDKFNRTAVCLRGGTLSITGGTITANATHKTNDHFQQPVEVRGGTATIDGLTVESDVAYDNAGAGAIVAWAPTTVNNVVVDFTGIGVWSDGPAVAITGEDTSIEATVNSVFAEEGGTITIADGDFVGALAVDSDPASGITVNGGTFDRQVPAEYAGTGLAPTTIAEDGKYTVKTARTVTFKVDGAAYATTVVADGEPVAAPADPTKDNSVFTGWTLDDTAYVFTTPVTEDIELVATFGAAKATVIRIVDNTPTNVGYYASLAEAIAAAQPGDTVQLLADDAADRVYVSKDLTLDLNDKTYTGRLTIDNGTVVVEGGTVAGRFDAYDSATVTLADDATVNGQVVVWGDGVYGEEGCKTPTLNVYGTVTFAGDAAITCNGTDKSGAVINVYEGAVVTCTDDIAIYLPSGKLTISGGTITGTTAVYAKSGSLAITGGTLTGTGAKADYDYNGDGANPTGDALVIDTCGYPNGNPDVSITGGTFISQNAQSVGSYAKNETFTAADDFIDEDGTARFSDADADGVPEGYYLAEVAGTSNPVLYEVAPRKSVIGTTITIADVGYIGTAQEPAPVVVSGETTLTATDDYTVAYADNVNAGTATVTITGANGWKDSTNVTFTIAKRVLSLTAMSDSKVYDGTALTKEGITYDTPEPGEGLLDGHRVDTYVVTGTQTDAGSSDNVLTSVTIKDANQVDVTANYELTLNKGTLTVTRAPIDFPTAATGLVYDGTVKTGVAAGTGYTLSGTFAATAAGGYTAIATPDSNHEWSAADYVPASMDATDPLDIDWSIARKDVTVTAVNAEKTIGTDDPASFTATVEGTVGSDTVSYTVSRAEGEAAGEYAITPAGDAVQGNYNVSYVPGTFTINNAYFTVTWLVDNAEYDKDENVAYGTAVSTIKPADPTKGPTAEKTFMFSAWSPEIADDATVTADVTYTANFTEAAREYTLTITYEGPTGFPAQQTYTAQVANGTEYSVASPVVEGYTPDVATVTGTMPTQDVTVTVTYTADAPTIISIALDAPTLDATGVSGKAIIVAADLGDDEISGAVSLTASPNGTVGAASAGVATASFTADWNEGVEWTLAADGVAPLKGKSYLKAETSWFTTGNGEGQVALTDNTTTLDFGDAVEAGAVPGAASAAGEQVRIQMSIEVSATGSSEAPAAAEMGGARGGITVVTNMYHAFNGASWVPLTGATPIDGDVDLLMVADMGAATPAVRYYIDGVALYDNSGETPVYAIPLKTVAEGNTVLNAVGISNGDALKSAITAEYDVPYRVAVGNTAYTAEADLPANSIDKTGETALELLGSDVDVGTITLSGDETVVVRNAGNFASGSGVAAAPGFALDEPAVAGEYTTYTVSAETYTVIWMVDATVYDRDEDVAYNTAIAEIKPADPTKDDTTYTYTFLGWASSAEGDVIENLPAVTADATYYAKFSATPKATGAVSGGVTIVNTEPLTFTSIVVGDGTVTVTFEGGIVVAQDADTTEIPFGIVYKTDLAATTASKAVNAALVTLDDPVEGEYSTGTAVITLPDANAGSFFLIGFGDATVENTNVGD